MEQLSAELTVKLKKSSTDKLRLKLLKAGYDEEQCLEMDRAALMSLVTEIWLKPAPTEHTAVVETPSEKMDDWRRLELELRRQELELRGQDMERIREENEK
jgi:hypothetical protein